MKSYCSFVVEKNLWVVLPYMAGGSCLDIMKFAYSKGFQEPIIAFVLREILKALDYLHQLGHIHCNVKVSLHFV
jgi:serine/threonine-protein kinase OSR1/STK39